jgi:hypothetical protein
MEIEIVDNLIMKEEADTLIKECCQGNNLGNKEILIQNINKDSELSRLLENAKPYFYNYQNKLPVKRKFFYDKVVAIENSNTDGEEHPLHFDESFSLYPSEIGISAFVSLIYLSDNFKGGQLYFPFQKKVIEPKVGRMLLFPCSAIYSHKILPFYDEKRYLLRIFHLFNSELEKDDRDRLTSRLNLKQEKKEL